jgi:hypothetical protein
LYNYGHFRDGKTHPKTQGNVIPWRRTQALIEENAEAVRLEQESLTSYVGKNLAIGMRTTRGHLPVKRSRFQTRQYPECLVSTCQMDSKCVPIVKSMYYPAILGDMTVESLSNGTFDPRWRFGKLGYPVHFRGKEATKCLGVHVPEGFCIRQVVKALGQEDSFRVISMYAKACLLADESPLMISCKQTF